MVLLPAFFLFLSDSVLFKLRTQPAHLISRRTRTVYNNWVQKPRLNIERSTCYLLAKRMMAYVSRDQNDRFA